MHVIKKKTLLPDEQQTPSLLGAREADREGD